MAVREGRVLLSSGRPTCHPALQMPSLPTSLQYPDLLGDLLVVEARPLAAHLPYAGELRRNPSGGSVARGFSSDHRQPRGQARTTLPADPRGAEAEGSNPRAPGSR